MVKVMGCGSMWSVLKFWLSYLLVQVTPLCPFMCKIKIIIVTHTVTVKTK